MSTYKLTYFDGKGRGETSRIMFALAGQEYEDNRIKKEQWMKLKPDTPFSSLPLLEVNGKTYCQSRAIERYLAKQFGLYGDTVDDQLKTDMIIDCMEDIANGVFKAMFIQDLAKKKEAKKEFVETKGNGMLQKVDGFLSSDGYSVGDKISWPDIAIYVFIDMARSIDDVDFDETKVPQIMSLMSRVESEPKIAHWIASRPK